jgi:hypothetical protein
LEEQRQPEEPEVVVEVLGEEVEAAGDIDGTKRRRRSIVVEVDEVCCPTCGSRVHFQKKKKPLSPSTHLRHRHRMRRMSSRQSVAPDGEQKCRRRDSLPAGSLKTFHSLFLV